MSKDVDIISCAVLLKKLSQNRIVMKIKKYGGMSMVKLVVLCALLRCYHAIYDMKRIIEITVLTSCIWIFSGFYLLKEVAKFKIPSEFMICTVAMQYLNIYIHIWKAVSVSTFLHNSENTSSTY